MFVESVAASLTKRVDDLVTTIAELKASLEFSQKDTELHKTQITLLDTNLQSAVEALNLSGVQEQTEPLKQGTSENIAKNYLVTHSSPDSFAKLVFIHVASTNWK